MRPIHQYLRLLTRAFFRSVQVVGADNVPESVGGIVVAWHPNGLIDPALILTHFPRRVLFGARHGLFRWPGLGWLMRTIGTVPIYRQADTARMSPEARRAANQDSLSALADAVSRGEYIALFPEGVSHDEPHPVDLKSGAARIYYAARSRCDAGVTPAIVPVGLFYDHKRSFRSHALMVIHPPMTLPSDLDVDPVDGEADEAWLRRARALTDEIEKMLRHVVRATEDWELHHLMHRARKIVRAERVARQEAQGGKPDMAERTLGFARIHAGYYARRHTHPELVELLRHRVQEYHDDLRAIGLEDHDLDASPRLLRPWLGILLGLQAVGVYLLLPPILVVGYLVNVLPALAVRWIAHLAARKRKDVATVKVLGGAVLFPMTWALVGFLGARAHEALEAEYPALPDTPALAGLSLAILAAVGGAIGYRYLRVARQTARAVRVWLFRRRRWYTISRLKQERADLYDALMDVAEGLDLPEDVTESPE